MVAANDILGYYRMIERIGAGGMGEVWKAEDTRLGRTVAIKILPPEIATDQEAIARMRREARSAAQANHPNIATIYSFEEIGDRLFIVEEYVEGEPLGNIIRRGAMAEAEACRIGRDVAEALAEAHAKGIVHRDIKPDNIIVSGRRVKVLDFGIAKQLSTQSGSNDPTAFMTQQGMIVGTVHYMSPEQALGKTLDARTDIFSLGIVLYQMVTGRLPFQGDTATETMMKIVRDEPPDPSAINRALSPNMTTIIARCLRKSREQRFDSAADLAAALDAQLVKASTAPQTVSAIAPTVVDERPVAVAPPPKKRSLGWVVWAVLLVVAAIVAFAIATRQRTAPQRAKNVPLAKPAAAAVPPAGTVVDVAPPAPAVKTTATQTTATEPPPTTNAVEGGGAIQKPPARSTATEEPAQAPPAAADQLFAAGLADLLAGREMKARREFGAAVVADPHHKKAHLGLAITNRNWPRARQLVREIHQQNPDDPDLQALRQFLEGEQQHRGRRQRPFVQ